MAVREGMTCVPYKGRGTFVVAAGRVATCRCTLSTLSSSAPQSTRARGAKRTVTGVANV